VFADCVALAYLMLESTQSGLAPAVPVDAARRVMCIQPAVPRYRLPVFQELHRLLDGQLVVLSSGAAGRVKQVAPSFPPFVDATLPVRAMFGRRLRIQAVMPHVRALSRGDVLLLNGMPRYLSSMQALLWAKMHGIPTVWWGHGWSAGSNAIRAGIRRQLMRIPDVILLYTEAERSQYILRGFDPKRTFAAQNTIDQAPIHAAMQNWPDSRVSEHLQSQGLVPHGYLLFVSRLTEKTRLDQLLAALKLLSTRGLRLPLVVVGDGPQRYALEAHATREELDVFFVGAIYDEETLAPYFLGAAALVYPGAIGLSINHSLSYGLPVIVHTNPEHQMPEWTLFRDGVNGIGFEEGDIAGLADACARMISMPAAEHAVLREASFETVRGMGTDAMARRIFEAIVAARERGANR